MLFFAIIMSATEETKKLDSNIVSYIITFSFIYFLGIHALAHTPRANGLICNGK